MVLLLFTDDAAETDFTDRRDMDEFSSKFVV